MAVASVVGAVATTAVLALLPMHAMAAIDSPTHVDPAVKALDYPFEPVPSMKSPLGVLAAKAARLVIPEGGDKSIEYMVARLQLANEVAKRLGLDTTELNAAWTRAPRDHQIALMFALSQVGVKYKEYETSPGVAIDCSGLLYLAWRTAGIEMPRGSQGQYNVKIRTSPRKAFAGDILGTGNHVQMWLGLGNAIVEAPSTGLRVRIRVVTDERAAKWTWANPSLIPITKWHPTAKTAAKK